MIENVSPRSLTFCRAKAPADRSPHAVDGTCSSSIRPASQLRHVENVVEDSQKCTRRRVNPGPKCGSRSSFCQPAALARKLRKSGSKVIGYAARATYWPKQALAHIARSASSLAKRSLLGFFVRAGQTASTTSSPSRSPARQTFFPGRLCSAAPVRSSFRSFLSPGEAALAIWSAAHRDSLCRNRHVRKTHRASAFLRADSRAAWWKRPLAYKIDPVGTHRKQRDRRRFKGTVGCAFRCRPALPLFAPLNVEPTVVGIDHRPPPSSTTKDQTPAVTDRRCLGMV